MSSTEPATEDQTQITLTQMSGREVEVVTVTNGGQPAVRTLSDAKAATLASLITDYLAQHGS